MKNVQFFFVCIVLLAINVKTSHSKKSIDVVTMDDNPFQISLVGPSYGTESSIIVKSHWGSFGYPTNLTSSCLVKAPRGYGLFVALRILDLRPKAQDYVSVIRGKDVFTYTNRNFYWDPQNFPYENTYTHYSPDGQMRVTFMTGGPQPSTIVYNGFELIFTVQANYTNCGKNTFHCDNKRCIADSLRCDGHNHCGDRSDQKFCTPIYNPTSKSVGWIAGGVIFAIIGLACGIYIALRRVCRSSRTETVITHPPPTQISSYPPYPQPGTGFPAPPPAYSPGYSNKGYH